jgi:mono/diheme cytochrome c family protein
MVRGKFHTLVSHSIWAGTLGAGAFLLLSVPSFAGEPTKASANAPVTYSKDIAPIFQEKCQDCHRKDSMAPMSLVTYEEARPWARSIKERVVQHQMPPWHLDRSVGIQSFQNDASLSEQQIATIVKWVDSGSPQGDPKDMPAPKQWPDDKSWRLEKVFNRPPDMIIKSTDYEMPAVSQDQWWKPVGDVGINEERWVRAVEMRPGTTAGRKITHHAIAHLIQEETDQKAKDSDETGQGGVLMEWAVGKTYDMYRPNTGKLLEPGAKVWWDIHYHAVGEKVKDHVELAVWLYPKDEKPKYRTYLTGFQATPGGHLDIAPNTVAVTQGFHTLKEPAILGNFQPHMHLRGKAMLLEAILPDGTTETISYVNNFNFNWMNNYIYTDEAAPEFPKGTIIHTTAWHDNTTAKASNPDPNQWVGWGDRTVDEMAHAWVNVTYISQEDYDAWAKTHRPAKGPRGAQTAAAATTGTGSTQ